MKGQFGVVVLLASAGLGCAHPPCPVPPQPPLASCGGPPAPPSVSPFGQANLDALDAYDRDAVRRVIDQARAVVQSPEFAAAISRIPLIGTGHGTEETSPQGLLTAYLGSGHVLETLSYSPSALLYPFRCACETAHTEIDPTHPKKANIVLRSCTRERAREACDCHPEPMACAINTVAHEWTHVLVRDGKQLYLDAGHESYGGRYLVSYTVGAVAQCVFLASRGAVRPSALDACIRDVGTTAFNPSSCAPGWPERRSW